MLARASKLSGAQTRHVRATLPRRKAHRLRDDVDDVGAQPWSEADICGGLVLTVLALA